MGGMRAVLHHGERDARVRTVLDPVLLEARVSEVTTVQSCLPERCAIMGLRRT